MRIDKYLTELRNASRDSKGLTLVDILIAMIITSIMAFVIMRVFLSTSSGLDRSAREAAAAVQATRFSLLIRYDVSGSQDAYIYGSTFPSDGSMLCSSSETNQARWNADPSLANAGEFRRSLFTLEIPTIGYNKSSWPGTMNFATRTNQVGNVTDRIYLQWVGYEIRKEVRDNETKFELWRVLCDPQLTGMTAPTPAMITKEERVVTLGSALNARVSGITSFLCYNRAGALLSVSEGKSTNSASAQASKRCSAFRFVLPYNGGRNALNRISGNAALGSIVDEWLQRLSTNVERFE